MTTIVPYLAAGLIGLLFHQYLRSFDFIFGSSAASRLERFASTDRRGVRLTDRVGDLIVDKLGFSFDSWKHELMWAQWAACMKDAP